jgi:hypothetical protein
VTTLVPGVKIRVIHPDCGQYTQLRKNEPKGDKTRCPSCGKLTMWSFVENCRINPEYFGSYWRTTAGEKYGPRLRKIIEEARTNENNNQ